MSKLSLIVMFCHLLSLPAFSQSLSGRYRAGLSSLVYQIHSADRWKDFVRKSRMPVAVLADYPVLFPLDRRGGRWAVSSRFGKRVHPVKKRRIFHAGVDIAVPSGTPVYASGSGKVDEAGYSSSYGWYIEIRHRGGFSTLYAHMRKLYVRKGSYVRMGQHIGAVGRTGVATGYHLHFELRKNGIPQDPLRWVLLVPPQSPKSY